MDIYSNCWVWPYFTQPWLEITQRWRKIEAFLSGVIRFHNRPTNRIALMINVNSPNVITYTKLLSCTMLYKPLIKC